MGRAAGVRPRFLRGCVGSDTPGLMQPDWRQPYAPPNAPAQPYQAFEAHGSTMIPATFGIRAGARIVDTIVGFVVGGIGGGIGGFLVGVLVATGSLDPSATGRMGKLSAGSFLFGLLGPLLYHAVAEGLGGATIGKLVCGLRVVREDGRPATLGGAFLRSIAYYIDGLFFGMVAYSVMSKNAMQQRLGDKWGHTAVVTAATVPADSRRGAAGPVVLGLVAWIAISFVSTVIKAF